MQVIAQQPATALGGVLSPSQARTFTDCSARWMFKYQWELPDPPSPALTLGQAVHAAIAVNFSQKIDTREDLPAEAVRKAYRDAFDELQPCQRENVHLPVRRRPNDIAVLPQGEHVGHAGGAR